jgi:hypothetical protein
MAERRSIPSKVAMENVAPESDTLTALAPSVLACGVLLLVIKSALRMFGFGRTFRAIRVITAGVEAYRGAGEELAIAAAHRVAMAAALFPGRALCLEQSLTLYCWLRTRGIPVELRIGIQAHPFQAHAWIEHRGDPINEDLERLKYFTPMPEIRP